MGSVLRRTAAWLAGVLLIGHIVGSTDPDVVLKAGDLPRTHPPYLPTLVLVLPGGFKKRAQVRFGGCRPPVMLSRRCQCSATSASWASPRTGSGSRVASTLSMVLPSMSTISRRQRSQSTVSATLGRRPVSNISMPLSV